MTAPPAARFEAVAEPLAPLADTIHHTLTHTPVRLDCDGIADLTAAITVAVATHLGLLDDTQRNQPVLRHCLMPGCLREFDAAAWMEGRPTRDTWSGDGWQQVRPTVSTGYTCPTHAPLLEQHQHRWVERSEDAPVRLLCSAAWQEHLHTETR